MADLVTIPAVPILRVGMGYPLASGLKTFTEEDLAAAANAYATDPAVKAPRIKIDALAKAWGLDPDAHGGEPAFGWFDNLRVSDNGQELLADMHCPEWVRDSLDWAFPSLSIEGPPPGWKSPSGRTHELVITAVALLGTDWPGCTTLDDFRELLAKGPDLAEKPDEVLVARMEPIRASLDSDLVARRFYDALDGGDIDVPEGVRSYDLWIRSLRFDDSGSPYLKITDEGSGRLYRVSVSVSGSEVTFGSMEEIAEQDVPVSAAARLPAPVASWNTREASRLAASTSQQRSDSSMTDEQRRAFARALGLPEDTTEDRLHEVAAERASASTETPPDPNQPTAPDPNAPNQPTPDQPGPPPVSPPSDPNAPNAPTTPTTVPEGMVLVEAQMWDTVRSGAEQGAQVADEMRRRQRDETITAAIGEGRFAPARRSHFEQMWDNDPDGTRVLLTAEADKGGLAKGLVPVTAEIGGAGDGEGVGVGADEGTGWFNFDEKGA